MKYSLLLWMLLVWKLDYGQISDFDSIDFSRADYRAKLYQGTSLDNLPLLAYNLTSKLPTEVEKFRAIYTWVCLNITGDANQGSKVSKKRKKFKQDSLAYIDWNASFKKIAFKKLLCHKKTMCTGYAYLIKELCFLANIDCQVINGYGRTSQSNIENLNLTNHSWNAVKLNDKWYLCDATWSSGYFIQNVFVKDYNMGYFLTDPILFSKNHIPIDKKWLLNESLIQKQFVPTPIVYGETFKNQIIPISPEEFHIIAKKEQEVYFKLQSLNSKTTNSISLIRFSGNKQHKFEIYDLKKEQEQITFKYAFKHQGVYDIHIKIGDDIVASHTIQIL